MGNGLTKSKRFKSRRTKNSAVAVEAVTNCPNEVHIKDPGSLSVEFVKIKDFSSNPKSDGINGVKLYNEMTVSELYNLVIAETWQGTPQIAEPYSTLMIDCRDKGAFDSRHVITAQHWSVYDKIEGHQLSQLTRYQLIILYGSKDASHTLQMVSSKMLDLNLEHYILKDSIATFMEKYYFVTCSGPSGSVGLSPDQFKTMPSEIIPGQLYQGNAKHATDYSVISSLGISHIVNITLELPNKFTDEVQYIEVPLADKSDEDLLSWMPKIISFINSAIAETDSSCPKSHGAVLVHCNLGRSRSSTAVIGYLMSAKRMSLLEACNLVKDCRPTARPNAGFLDQLLKYERDISENRTSYTDLPF